MIDSPTCGTGKLVTTHSLQYPESDSVATLAALLYTHIILHIERALDTNMDEGSPPRSRKLSAHPHLSSYVVDHMCQRKVA